MLRAEDFQLLSVQAALFLADTKALTQSGFLAAILGKYATRYDGAVQAIPFVENAPPEIPRVILQSKDEHWKLQAALNRIDSFWNTTDLTQGDESISSQCVEVLEHYIQMNPALQISRVGFLINRIVEKENPARELIERFCNDESKVRPFNNSESFEIHHHKTYKLKQTGYAVNSWVRCKAVRIIQPQQKRAVIVEQDINTVEDPGSVFDLDSARRFYRECQAEADEILSIYFP